MGTMPGTEKATQCPAGGGGGGDDGGRARLDQDHRLQQIAAENNDLRLEVVDGQEKVMAHESHLALLMAQIQSLGVEPCAAPPDAAAE